MQRGLYTIAAVPSVIAGTLLLLSGPPGHQVAFAAALVAGGAALIWLGVGGRRIGRAGWAAVGVLTIAGFFASLLVVREDIACMFCYHRGRGYPWGWLDTDFTNPDMATVDRAHQIMATDPGVARPTLDGFKVILDGVFWAYVALPLVIVTVQAGRIPRRSRPAPRATRS